MRKEKTFLLEEMEHKAANASAMLFMRYDRLEPNAVWELRSALAAQQSSLGVVKKRVFMKALAKTGVTLDETLLQGHIGVVFISGADAMAPTKTTLKFSQDNGDVLQVLCGYIEGAMLPGSEVEMLSKLPSLDEMRASLLGLFTAPMSQMLSVLEAKVAQGSEEKE